MTITKTASAKWQGGIKNGKGHISTESGVLSDQPYGFNTRFEDGQGTNPEELIGAAHAGCFSMALSKILGEHDLTADSIETKASVSLEKDGEGFSITKIHLTLNATIPGADESKFEECASMAKEGCPVSKVLNADITLDASLNGARLAA